MTTQEYEPCPECKGTGLARCRVCGASGKWGPFDAPCGPCAGTGNLGVKCGTCLGAKTVVKKPPKSSP